MIVRFSILLCTLVLITSCSTPKSSSYTYLADPSFTFKTQFHGGYLNQHTSTSMLFRSIEDDLTQIDIDAQKLMTPASNVKVLTLYTALQFIQDSIAWMKLYQGGAQTYFEPCGDPTFLHPNFPNTRRLFSYFKNIKTSSDTLRMSFSHMRDAAYGKGWMWDDYTYAFQPEKSAFPLHSNYAYIKEDSIYPSYLAAVVDFGGEDLEFDRALQANTFRSDLQKNIPLHMDAEVYQAYFDQFGLRLKTVDIWDRKHEMEADWVYSFPKDTVLKEMMYESDNLVAEQLLLQSSYLQYGVMSSSAIIRKMKQEYLEQYPDMLWVDGSGLSRYNMISAHLLHDVLKEIYLLKGMDYIKDIFPPIQASFDLGADQDLANQVFGKTGSMTGVFNYCGYLKGNSNRWYIFSFMVNGIPAKDENIKTEILEYIRYLKMNY